MRPVSQQLSTTGSPTLFRSNSHLQVTEAQTMMMVTEAALPSHPYHQ
jgi:hypothetical protein